MLSIIKKYESLKHNADNYNIGGGLCSSSFSSKRHEDAKCDKGKLTLGSATALFKSATGLPSFVVKSILKKAIPNMEWHHAGKLPASYGGGMKKTYFLKAHQVYECAVNWDSLLKMYL